VFFAFALAVGLERQEHKTGVFGCASEAETGEAKVPRISGMFLVMAETCWPILRV